MVITRILVLVPKDQTSMAPDRKRGYINLINGIVTLLGVVYTVLFPWQRYKTTVCYNENKRIFHIFESNAKLYWDRSHVMLLQMKLTNNRLKYFVVHTTLIIIKVFLQVFSLLTITITTDLLLYYVLYMHSFLNENEPFCNLNYSFISWPI